MEMTLYELAGKALGSSYEESVFQLAIRGLAARPEGFVLAVDFDGTLCVDMYPEIGLPWEDMVNRVTLVKSLGVQVVLWTCREGALLEAALDWCVRHGLVFHAVNENLPGYRALYGNDPRKVGYDELWDDRAVEMGRNDPLFHYRGDGDAKRSTTILPWQGGDDA